MFSMFHKNFNSGLRHTRRVEESMFEKDNLFTLRVTTAILATNRGVEYIVLN